jgi:hypothetical protein
MDDLLDAVTVHVEKLYQGFTVDRAHGLSFNVDMPPKVNSPTLTEVRFKMVRKPPTEAVN